ncbi:MAG: GerMN domain-containing protein [Clostridia bacterium]|nr:GerMN domain-containing protein [Clostridia bacterium]
MAKRRRLIALLLVFTAAMTGLPGGALGASVEEDIVLPEPAARENEMILGESYAGDTREVTLYFVTEGSSNLTSAARAIRLEKGKTLVESALSQLLNARFTAGVQSAASTDMQLIDVEFGCGIATVDLSIGSSGQLNDQTELLRCVAIANTLLGIEGVEAVNILTGGRSDAICSLPMGVFIAQNDSVPTLYARLQSERESFLGDPSETIRRSAVVYFPTTNSLFLPELRTLDFASEGDFITALLDALKAGPQGAWQSFSPIPASDEEILAGQPALRVNEAGERIVEIDFTAMLPNYLAFSGVDPWQLYGSIVLTLTSFVPELDGVVIRIEGEPVSELAMGEQSLRFTGGLMRRSDFSANIGSSAALYFADSEGKLTCVECAVPQMNAAAPRSLLTTLVATPAPDGLERVIPAEISAADILGVQIDGRIATVNLSGNFYTRCQSLTASEERSLIYAMVNTLAELPGIGAVRFLVEGNTLDRLSQEIYLKTALLPDPGLAG